ncbi:hypothetical protein COY90_03190 [Candidatus Roizmanbacteria bacterium CG_4_10_14_0_8_um_filter_39_9]|uniref:Cof-type HAD-IIB family hydrolase n=1 Tax=Candidatus Roizmanbacteria bacterium CG_4_10_14_0_8_um_filter_39_9 TaxID=1974829 RepID=A0A2M7QCL7_9BACT|nr:MAG: hypothetical protein COY90_03190 [Candidatus Roizmanbacteria bacterium CG_4_10_14_0_8_um_filter_39_9]
MTIKAILSDLDGSLVSCDGHYDVRLPALLQKLREKNIHFSLATGRACYGLVEKLLKELNLYDYHIVFGGGMILNVLTGETPWLRPISEKSVRKIVSYYNTQSFLYSVETTEAAYMFRRFETFMYPTGVIVRDFIESTIPPGVLKILLQSSINKLSEKIAQKHIKHILNECKDVEVVRLGHEGYFGWDVTAENSTKHTAVLEYGKILKINPKEMVAIGDGYNDYPLFTACGYKIAMGNAPKELKDIADLVVAPVESGGIIEAIEHVLTLAKII